MLRDTLYQKLHPIFFLDKLCEKSTDFNKFDVR